MAPKSAPRPVNALWLTAGSCGGCVTASLLAEGPGLPDILDAFGIRFLWHPLLCEETGTEVMEVLDAVTSGREPLDMLVVEGAILRGPHGTGRFQLLSGTGQPMADWVERLAGLAEVTVAVGSCAAFGGMASTGDVTEATGLHYDGEQPGGLLGADYRSRAGLPVINVAGCAPHPDWISETLISVALGEVAADDLDALNRPKAFFSKLAHHGCSRNEYYEFKASAESPAEQGCLMENLGCRATQAHGDCNIRPWNGRGSCAEGGSPCIACTSPAFEAPGAPFARTPKVAGIPVGLPVDMPKAWFVALAALSKSATPERVRRNAVSDTVVVAPSIRKRREP